MVKFVSKLISKIKHREYHIDENITSSDLMGIVFSRMIMLIRGLFCKAGFKSSGKIAFIGKRVKIQSKKHIQCGSGLTIEDGCFINALCKGGVKIGDNFSLGKNSIIECTGVIRELGESLEIGDNVGIAANAFISVRGDVKIGNSTIFGPGVKIFSENHIFADRDTPIYLQGASRKGVEIGEDCWIGANAVILDGVKIGKGCVVAAGAVVNKDFDDYSVIGGVPAKVISNR
ncbi:MAG: acyltransferase [Clostridium sp.]|nr:acyltransferase [Clostridium sp.]